MMFAVLCCLRYYDVVCLFCGLVVWFGLVIFGFVCCLFKFAVFSVLILC